MGGAAAPALDGSPLRVRQPRRGQLHHCNLLLSHFTDFTVLRDDPDHCVHKAVKAAVDTYNVEESQHYMHIVTSLLEAGAPVEKNSIVAVSNAQSDPGSMQPDRLQEAAPLLAVLNDAYQDQVRA